MPQFGWVGRRAACRTTRANGSQSGGGALSPGKPVTLTWDNGQGLVFTRVIVDRRQIHVQRQDSVANKRRPGVTLYPFADVTRAERAA